MKNLCDMKQLKEFTVIRSQWVNGSNSEERGDPCLMNEQGYLCCLGFACRNMGVNDRQLLNNSTPEDVLKEESKITTIGSWNINRIVDNSVTDDAIRINDDEVSSQKKKELDLTILFKNNGVDIIFKD